MERGAFSMVDVTKGVTDDFVESFKSEADLSGPFFCLILDGYSPIGLDVNDPRVKQILERAHSVREGPLGLRDEGNGIPESGVCDTEPPINAGR